MPSAKARDFQRVALHVGFVLKRTTASHERRQHPDGQAVTIPLHARPEIGPLLFFKILRQFGLTLAEFEKLR
jgi:predicted RNA binding protein YcfA (HicA-like mRNA interferase family)